MQEQLDKEQTKRQEAEMTRMYDLLERKLIKHRDISEDTCMLVDEKVISFSKAVWSYGRHMSMLTSAPAILQYTTNLAGLHTAVLCRQSLFDSHSLGVCAMCIKVVFIVFLCSVCLTSFLYSFTHYLNFDPLQTKLSRNLEKNMRDLRAVKVS